MLARSIQNQKYSTVYTCIQKCTVTVISWNFCTMSKSYPDLGVPAAHVIWQQPETLALANQHLLWDELEDRVIITLCSSVILNLL